MCRLSYITCMPAASLCDARFRMELDRPEQAAKRRRGCRPVRARTAFVVSAGPGWPLYMPQDHSRHSVQHGFRARLREAVTVSWTTTNVPSGACGSLGFFDSPYLASCRRRVEYDCNVLIEGRTWRRKPLRRLCLKSRLVNLRVRSKTACPTGIYRPSRHVLRPRV